MSLPRAAFSLSVLLALLGSGVSRPGTAWAVDHPVVIVTVQFESKLLEEEGHLASPLREPFQNLVVESTIREATKNFPCMEWRAESSSARPRQVYAELQAVVMDRNFGQEKEVFLTYRAVFDGQKAQDLHSVYDRKILGATGNPGNFPAMSTAVSEQLPKLFADDRFRPYFNEAFIGKIAIARDLEHDSRNQWLMIPVKADSLKLDPESPLLLELIAPVCKKKAPQHCKVSLVTTGKYLSGPWENSLHTRVEKVPCCPAISLQELASEAKKPENKLAIFLDSRHTHCKHSSFLCQIARHPGVEP